jgi:ribosome-binding ATPase YchF (GTP1/OBG family)
MSKLLKSIAVARRSGEESGELLQQYINTGPLMTQAHTLENAPKAPNAAGSIDPMAK